MIKSPAEIALMQAAAEVTMMAYRSVHGRIRAGMTPADIGGMMRAATEGRGRTPRIRAGAAGRGERLPARHRQAAAGLWQAR
jgi:Xaa-Pro dipeptidase